MHTGQDKHRTKIARIFATYGPRMQPNDGRVGSNFIVQALTGQPLTLYSDGSQTRSFCYVADTVDALIRLMNAPDGFAGPVHIGNLVEHTVSELADLVLRLARSSSAIVHAPAVEDDPRQRKPDIALASAVLAWRPQTGIEEGLRATIRHFEALLACTPVPRVA